MKTNTPTGLHLFSLCLILILPFTAFGEDIPSGAQIQAEAERNTSKVTTVELNRMLEEELDMVLIDIRTADEIRNMAGTIDAPQNINIPRGWLEFRVQRIALEKNTPIVVYCGGGLRSPLAAETLQQMGYTDVKDYAEGYLGWKKAGLPIKP